MPPKTPEAEQTKIIPKSRAKKPVSLQELSKDDLLVHLEALKKRGQDRLDPSTEYGALIDKLSNLGEKEFQAELKNFADPKAAGLISAEIDTEKLGLQESIRRIALEAKVSEKKREDMEKKFDKMTLLELKDLRKQIKKELDDYLTSQQEAEVKALYEQKKTPDFKEFAESKDVIFEKGKFGNFEIEMAGIGEPSSEHTDHTEDRAFANIESGEMVLCDGVSRGDGKGELAAEFFGDKLKNVLSEISDDTSEEEAKRIIREKFLEVNEELNQQIDAMQGSPEKIPGQTTASAVKLLQRPDGRLQAVIASVGDSPVFIRRKNGTIEKITVDDNALSYFVNEIFPNEKKSDAEKLKIFIDQTEGIAQARGKKDLKEKDVVDYYNLLNNIGAEEIKRQKLGGKLDERLEIVHNMLENTITQGLGKRAKIEPNVRVIDIEEGDVILAASDGLTDNLLDEEIGEEFYKKGFLSKLIKRRDSLKNTIDRLKERTKTRPSKPKPDDITLVVMEIKAKKKK